MGEVDGRGLQLPVRVRAEGVCAPRYRPGARQLPPDATGVRAVRLASNELAFGPLPGVLEALRDRDAVVRYPDSSATAVRDRLADHLGTVVARIAVGNGSVGLVEQIIRLTVGHGDELVMGSPSFNAYATLARAAGATPVGVPLTGAALDLEAMARAVTERTRVVFVCTPNNPTGGVVGAAAVKEFLTQVPPDLLVVVDEAYREFVEDPDAVDGLDLAAEHDNVLSLRTFSKAYGLAGLRLGYCVGHPAIVEALNATQPPFAVNAPAQRAGVASLGCGEELAERVRSVLGERRRVRSELTRLGFDVPVSHGNFLWLPTGESTGSITSALARAGILVRPVGDLGIRATVGSPEENTLFVAALARVVLGRTPERT